MKKRFVKGLALGLLVSAYGQSQAQTKTTDPLLKNFMTTNEAARPRVWWHWMNGNITKDGIRKDLLWMHRSGIGGFQNFDAGLTTPQIVSKRLTYMTPEWQDAFRYTTKLADSLKLEMAIAGSPGWSESGGPWVEPKDGMKKIVWSEMRVKGGQPFNGQLPKPPNTTGDFQNLPLLPGFGAAGPVTPAAEYYGDIAVIAYRLPAADIALDDLKPTITSSGGSFNLAQLTDGDLATTTLLPSDTVKGYAWIQYEFTQPQTIKAVSVVGGGTFMGFGVPPASEDRILEASDDGVNFRRIDVIPISTLRQLTISIPATTAKYFRVTFKNPPPPINFGALMGGRREAPKPPAGTGIAELVLHPAARINHAEEKAGYAAGVNLSKYPTPAASDVVAEADVVDLTSKLTTDGTLNWTIPSGNWKIVRFGYSLTGKLNHPASPEATGLEVNKLDGEAVKRYFENYLDQYKNATGGLMGAKGLQYMVTDSYESGQENWTPKMAEEFQKRRGYSLRLWMPVLTGAVIKSVEASEQFLWDFRKTIGELIVENHYDQLTDILAKRGMKRYTESHENGRVFIVDGMEVKRTAAVPMSAMWTPGPGGSTLSMAEADIRESASVAHIYGQNLVAAESLTAIGFGPNGAWSYSPEKLKPTADLELANGLNRFVIHTSAHQPVDDKIPGLGLGPFGQWFNRHETWAPQAKVWTDYLARSSYMLQQGKFVADVVYYYGEDNNVTFLFGQKMPAIPAGYNFDFINADALVNLLQVKEGRLVTPSGMRYRVMALDSNSRQMTLKVARKLRDLVKAGAVVVGPKPTGTPSLNDDKAEFNAIVNELWSANGSAAAGKVRGQSLQAVLSDLNVAPDFTYAKPQATTELRFVHRTLPGADVFWVNNRNNRVEDLQARFRVSGKEAEVWHPETGKVEKVSYSSANGITTVPLHLEPADAVFVVFKNTTTQASYTAPQRVTKELMTLDGPWNVSFQPNRGAPAQATFTQLASFTDNSNAGIKYFSGTATYTKRVNVPANMLAGGRQVMLDLGDVKNLAEVTVNGKSLGTVWKAPFKLDVGNALKAGENVIEVKVTNLWVNRLIGDAQPGVTSKITYTALPFYQADSKLLPSGLLGPVKLIAASVESN
ncbi:glycoside hydrolase [Spirosoma taeanense]|uniref:Glycoside hydrolase n=1 Tax=Spirosoma taeanense TaxID=2735870 RepID=A0A6M5YDA3_9BACT|nr:glycosyl hydrolase [Spirosoma taeanense]QJW91251.1 glycoside hydrolase [Spirosoma taeanense]